jgi:uncharacterized membrane protein YgdD (TMEM256/DUF423 family)
MKIKMRLFGSLFMAIGILLGALGSHYLDSVLDPKSLQSFEVGLRYLLYQGLGLLVLSLLDFQNQKTQKYLFYLMAGGTVLFSGSIFILSLRAFVPFSVSFLGPLTPLGGTAMILAWILTALAFLKKEK